MKIPGKFSINIITCFLALFPITLLRLNNSQFSTFLINVDTHSSLRPLTDSITKDTSTVKIHQFKFEDTVSLTKALDVYVSYQYMGSRLSPNSATYSDDMHTLSNYHLLDAQLAYKISSSIHGRAGVKNILDEAYEWEYGYPSQGRSYYIQMEWKI